MQNPDTHMKISNAAPVDTSPFVSSIPSRRMIGGLWNLTVEIFSWIDVSAASALFVAIRIMNQLNAIPTVGPFLGEPS